MADLIGDSHANGDAPPATEAPFTITLTVTGLRLNIDGPQGMPADVVVMYLERAANFFRAQQVAGLVLQAMDQRARVMQQVQGLGRIVRP